MTISGSDLGLGAAHTIERRRARVPAVVAGLCLSWLLLTVPAATAAETAQESRSDTFLPIADARVEEAQPTANLGSATRMGVDGDPGLRVESVLRFEVAGLAGQIQGAALRLYVVSDGTVDGPELYPGGGDWTESRVTWDTRPEPTGPAVADVGRVAAGTWVELDVTPLVTRDGPVTLLLRQAGLDGAVFYSREGRLKPQLVVRSGNPVVMAAGDIACRPDATVTLTRCRQGPVSDLLVQTPGVARVLALGDLQYQDGLYPEFLGAGAYDATWGRAKAITQPVPGNHEYHVPGAPGYFDYFNGIGIQSGPAGERGNGYYSFDLGSWHLIALNSEIPVSAASEQRRWLTSDLAATSQRCLLAYWHEPRFSSGSHGAATWVAPLWTALHDARADIVLNGHDHDYERFAKQDPSGRAHPKGIREFVVGTGGASHGGFGVTQPNSEVRDDTTFGALKLTLREASYEWEFVPEAGGTFTDRGSDACNDEPPAPSLSLAPSTGYAPLAVTADASGSTDAGRTPIASYEFDFGDASPVVGPQPGATATHTYERPGSYTVTVTVSDTGGGSRTTTADVVVKGNLVRNAGFEAGVVGWNGQPIGHGIAVERVEGGHTGEWAARVTNAGVLASGCTLNDSPNWVMTTSRGTYTATLSARADFGGGTMKLRLAEWSGPTLLGSARTTVTLTSDWQPVTVTYQPLAPGSSTLDLSVYQPIAPPGTCFYADDVAIEQG